MFCCGFAERWFAETRIAETATVFSNRFLLWSALMREARQLLKLTRDCYLFWSYVLLNEYSSQPSQKSWNRSFCKHLIQITSAFFTYARSGSVRHSLLETMALEWPPGDAQHTDVPTKATRSMFSWLFGCFVERTHLFDRWYIHVVQAQRWVTGRSEAGERGVWERDVRRFWFETHPKFQPDDFAFCDR
jgi:hypothetical protein